MSSRLSLRDNTKKSKIFDLNRKEIVVYVYPLKFRKILTSGTLKSTIKSNAKSLSIYSKCRRMINPESPFKSKVCIMQSIDKISGRIYFRDRR